MRKKEMGKNTQALLCALVILCVLFSVYLDDRGPIISYGSAAGKSAAAIRLLPVYSYLEKARTDDFAIDCANADMGYIAAAANCADSVRIRITSSAGAERIYIVPDTGEVAYYPLSDGNGVYTITLLKKSGNDPDNYRYESIMSETCEADLFDEFQPFLRPSTYVRFTGHSDCVNAAAELCAGESDDNVKIARIRQFVCTKLNYDDTIVDEETQTYIRDPDVILTRGTGVCLDYAVLTAAMLRSQGIPAKVVYGSVVGTEGLHAWNMVYTTGGWIRVDTTFEDSGLDRIMISNDENYSAEGWY